ncbi:unnamed protein product [Cyclocybe aegerita]|uniref:FMN-binding split barrel n=1 Tax=Cyclocybe aegerita TaxID=1973307 RepID=A0A8S0WD72_CYCAE|nr:unnamed protein product [Cyclocybe aegerita]
MSDATQYEKTPRSTVNRLKQRAVYDQETIRSIIDTSPILHVSFLPVHPSDDPFPTILPMLGCFGAYTAPNAELQSAPAIYLHGHSASRFFKLPGNTSSWAAEEGLPGLPVCVAATHIDGLVLALTPFNHSSNYRSAVVHGYAQLVTDAAEKDYALTLITDNIVPERWANSRVPPTEAEMKTTSVIRVDVVSASAKVRAYTAGNDKADLEDESVVGKVWTGVVPMWTQYGEPVPAVENRVSRVPEHVARVIEERNAEGEQWAKDIATRKAPKKT